MPFNLRHLKYFIATAEIGQVSRAAVELSVSQSAVTTAIKELEATVETQLFLRSPQGMALTEAGRSFLSSAHEILLKADEALNVGTAAPVSGRIAVAASYTVIGYFLPPHLERLSRLQPKLEVQLHEMTRETIEEGLLAGRFDMGVALTANIANPDLVCETLLRSARRLWTPSRHRLLEKESVSLADVAQEPYVMLTVDEAAHTAMRYWAPTSLTP
ncbi:MAG: LysR family transcriptional regulator, partial [Pseudomonadota bacterium]